MKHDRRAVTRMLASLGAMTGGPALTPALAQAKTVEVTMKNDPRGLFVPDSVNIAKGDTVNWTNSGLITHTVTFDPSQAVNREDVALPAGAAQSRPATWKKTPRSATHSP